MSLPHAEPDLITVREAASLLNVSEKWVRRHIADGTVPFTVYRIGKHIRLDRYMIGLWLEHLARLSRDEQRKPKQPADS